MTTPPGVTGENVEDAPVHPVREKPKIMQRVNPEINRMFFISLLLLRPLKTGTILPDGHAKTASVILF
jgi:hypothetical protein